MKFDTRSPMRIISDKYFKRMYLRGKTCDIGAKNRIYENICEELITLDVCNFPEIDIIADAHNLPFTAKSFDNIIMASLLEHVQNPPKLLDEAYRILKPNGLIVVSAPFMYPFHADPNDYWRFTDEGLKYLLRSFKIIKIHKIGGFFSLIGLYLHNSFIKAKLRFLLPLLSFFIWLDERTSSSDFLKRTSCGFLIVAKKEVK